MENGDGLIDVGRFRAASCAGRSRRSFLRLGATLPLLGGLTQSALGAPTGRAKSVLFVWLWGAPSHVDLCDPKPAAPIEFRGPFAPIATRTPGMQFSEILPRLAARSDRFSVIRSHVTSEPGHPDAGTVGMTGFKERPEPVQPSFGSIVGKHRGHRGNLPPYVMVGQGIPRDVVRIVEGYGGGKFGKAWDPFQISCSDAGEVNIPSLHLIDGITPNRITDRRTLLNQVDSSVKRFEVASQAEWNRVYQRAVNLLTTSEARQAFDLTVEQTKTRQAYGHTSFGQSCLLARRLVEAEVPFVQVNWSQYVESITPNCDFGWDTHIYNFELLQDTHGPIFDRAFSALLDDLDDRGLLDSTLVVAMGEFGRTPRINNRAARDHWPRCYFSMWAGGGVQPGRCIGESDKLAEDPVTSPITPLMVGTTIAELAGIDTQARAEMNVLEGGETIHELL